MTVASSVTARLLRWCRRQAAGPLGEVPLTNGAWVVRITVLHTALHDWRPEVNSLGKVPLTSIAWVVRITVLQSCRTGAQR